jgi:DNA-3-methyladenine glycosylase I
MVPLTRCDWARKPLEIAYHDLEWGVPVHDDRLFFELLTLEGAQAGLSWFTILGRRNGYRAAFAGFDPAKVALFDAGRVEALMSDPRIIRSQPKIQAAIGNARAFLEVQREFGSFDSFIWRFVDGKPKKNMWSQPPDVPSKTEESEAMSKDLVSRGFQFAGPKICYAFMQASGMVNDHLVACFRHAEISG